MIRGGVAIGELTDAQARLIDEATASAGSASLSDIQHVVILMQENRSFDHYFGTLSGVRRARPGDHGLLHPRRPALLLRPRGRVHRLRRLLQLGDPTANAMPSQETSPKRPPVP
jgi:phospholipase C